MLSPSSKLPPADRPSPQAPVVRLGPRLRTHLLHPFPASSREPQDRAGLHTAHASLCAVPCLLCREGEGKSRCCRTPGPPSPRLFPAVGQPSGPTTSLLPSASADCSVCPAALLLYLDRPYTVHESPGPKVQRLIQRCLRIPAPASLPLLGSSSYPIP